MVWSTTFEWAHASWDNASRELTSHPVGSRAEELSQDVHRPLATRKGTLRHIDLRVTSSVSPYPRWTGQCRVLPATSRRVGRPDYRGPVRLQLGMQLVDAIAVDPERHAPPRMRCRIDIHPRFAKTEGDGVGIEEDEIGSVEARIGREPQRLCVEGARGGEVAHLQADEIGAAKSCHELPFPWGHRTIAML